MTEWQDISNAPKDGTPFLGYFKKMDNKGHDGKRQGMPFQIMWWGDTVLDNGPRWMIYGIGGFAPEWIPDCWCPITPPSPMEQGA